VGESGANGAQQQDNHCDTPKKRYKPAYHTPGYAGCYAENSAEPGISNTNSLLGRKLCWLI
jgi:hypothetical protein